MTLDGQPVDSFEYNKVRALLAYLVVECESPHRREALAGLLWPDQSQKAALDSLRNALSKLRQAIGDKTASPTYLLITNDAIQFNHSSDHWLDVQRFNQLLDKCKTHHHRRIEGCLTCTDRLIEVTTLHRGEFLQEFSMPDSDLFEDWLRLQREKLSRLVLENLQQLASIYERQGAYVKALTYTHRQLELDPCCEAAHLQAMRLLASNNQRVEAYVQYEKCRKILVDELGVEPAEETTRLYEQIKYGVFLPAPTLDKLRFNNLPPNLTSFVGREQELADINALIEDPNCRLLTLVGPGGVGKTRLAITAAGQQMEAFPHGACFVPLAGSSSTESIVPSILQALSLKQSEQGNLKDRLFDYLLDKELILILDNFEHLVEAAGLVTEILHKAPDVMVLITSRQRLGLQSEWLFEVNGLSYPSGKPMQDLAAYEAVQLFTARLHQVKTRVTLFKEDLPSISRICQLVEGLPLGIELAASAVRLRSIGQVAEAIESGKEDLRVSYKDVPERHRSLRAVFDHSYRLLSVEEQSAFVGLAVFRGGFTAEAAEQVAGATYEILQALVEHSLVRIDPEKERYDLHELVRQYAQEKLKDQGLETTLHQRHLSYFTDMADQAETYFIEKNQRDHFKNLVPDVENFRKSLEGCTENGEMQHALQLAGALGIFWALTGYWQEGDGWMVKILASENPFPRDRFKARILMYAGFLAQIRDIAAGISLSEQALSIWRELGDEPRIAFTLSDIGRWVIRLGDYDKARGMLEESLKTFQELGDQAHTAHLMNILAIFYYNIDDQNNLDQVRTLFEQSLEINRHLGLNYMVAMTIGNLGNLELNQGNFIIARKLLEEGLALIKGQTNLDILAWTLGCLGDVSLYLEDYPAATGYFERSLEVYRNIGRRPLDCLCCLSYLSYRQQKVDQSLYILKEVFSQLEATYNVTFPVETLERMLGILPFCGEVERAARLYAFTAAVREKFNKNMLPYMRSEYDQNIALVRTQLGVEAFAKAWEEGRSMTLEQAKACALEAKVRINEASKHENPALL